MQSDKKKRSQQGWVRATYWKYLPKAWNPSNDDSLRGERSLQMAFESINGSTEPSMDRESMMKQSALANAFERTHCLEKDGTMKRVDPDSVDCYFADYEGDSWTSSAPWSSEPECFQESELLAGVEAMIDLLQAAQVTTSTTEVSSQAQASRKTARR
ncbi:MAG: hypothetical protein U0905_17710 [Pirellulales bacterium]